MGKLSGGCDEASLDDLGRLSGECMEGVWRLSGECGEAV